MFALNSAHRVVMRLCASVLVAAGLLSSTGAANTALAERAETVHVKKAKANYKFAGTKRVKRSKSSHYKRKKLRHGRLVARVLRKNKTRAARRVSNPPSIRGGSIRGYRGLNPRLRRLLAVVRRHYGRPVIISSGCRSHRHNRRVGGAKHSLHLRCMAADFKVAGVSKASLRRYVSGLPGRGGVGTYCGRNIVHLDVGPRRSWYYGCRKRRRR